MHRTDGMTTPHGSTTCTEPHGSTTCMEHANVFPHLLLLISYFSHSLQTPSKWDLGAWLGGGGGYELDF